LTGQVIHSDARGTVSELAFARGARIEPHANPNTSYFIVVEGGGWVGVDGERTRIAAGEAAVWPADIIHSAWTEHSEMRAFIVEFAGPDDAVVGGTARELADADASAVARGVGELAARAGQKGDPREGEPA
jgi:quercetin dioxygenase-like cupin family protein